MQRTETITGIKAAATKKALRDIVRFPITMPASYFSLMLYFKAGGGYKTVVLKKDQSAHTNPSLQSINDL